MPKDTGKYQYFTVGLERDSWALERFKADAKKHHMSDQPGKLIALRLTEYYELITQPDGTPLLVVTIATTDPTYLRQPFVISSQFKKEANDAKWKPSECSATW